MRTLVMDYENPESLEAVRFNPWMPENFEVTRIKARIQGLPSEITNLRLKASYHYDHEVDKTNYEKEIRLGFMLPVSDTPIENKSEGGFKTNRLKLSDIAGLLDLSNWNEGREASISIDLESYDVDHIDVILEVSWSDSYEFSKHIYRETDSPKVRFTVTPKSEEDRFEARYFTIPFKPFDAETDTREDFIEMAMKHDVYEPKGMGNSLHQKQVLTSIIMKDLIKEKFRNKRDLTVNYIGTDTWENLFSTVRSLIFQGIWNDISKFVIWYEEEWDKEIMDKYRFLEKLGNWEKISIRSKENLDGDFSGDVTICTYVAPWALHGKDQQHRDDYNQFLQGTLSGNGTLIVVDPQRDSYVRSRPVPTSFRIQSELTIRNGWYEDTSLKRKLKMVPKFQSCKYDLFRKTPPSTSEELGDSRHDQRTLSYLRDIAGNAKNGDFQTAIDFFEKAIAIGKDIQPDIQHFPEWSVFEEEGGSEESDLDQIRQAEAKMRRDQHKIRLWGIQKSYSDAMASILNHTYCAGKLTIVDDLFHPELHFIHSDHSDFKSKIEDIEGVDSWGDLWKNNENPSRLFEGKISRELGSPLDPSSHKDGLYLLTATAGMGKSTAFRNLARIVLEERPDNEDIEWVEDQSTLPIFITAKSLEPYIDFASLAITFSNQNLEIWKEGFPYSKLWTRTLKTLNRAKKGHTDLGSRGRMKKLDSLGMSIGISLEAMIALETGHGSTEGLSKTEKMSLKMEKKTNNQFDIHLYLDEGYGTENSFDCFVQEEGESINLQLLCCAFASSAIDTYKELGDALTHSELVKLISHGIKTKKISLFVDALDEAKDAKKVIQFIDRAISNESIICAPQGIDYWTTLESFAETLEGGSFKKTSEGVIVHRYTKLARVYLSTRPEKLSYLTERMKNECFFSKITYTNEEIRQKLPIGLLRGWGVETKDSLSKLAIAQIELPSVFRNPWEIGHALSMIQSGTLAPDNQIDLIGQSDWEFLFNVLKLWRGVYPDFSSVLYMFSTVDHFIYSAQFNFETEGDLLKDLVSRSQWISDRIDRILVRSGRINSKRLKNLKHKIEEFDFSKYDKSELKKLMRSARGLTPFTRFTRGKIELGAKRLFNPLEEEDSPYEMIPADLLIKLISNQNFLKNYEKIQPKGKTSLRDKKIADFYSKILEFNIENSLSRKGNLNGLDERERRIFINEAMMCISILSSNSLLIRPGENTEDLIRSLWDIVRGVPLSVDLSDKGIGENETSFPRLKSLGFERFFRIFSEDFSSLFALKAQLDWGGIEWEHERLRSLAFIKLIHENNGSYPELRRALADAGMYPQILLNFQSFLTPDIIKIGFSLYGQNDMVSYLNQIYEQIQSIDVNLDLPSFGNPEQLLFDVAEDNDLTMNILENWKKYWFETYMKDSKNDHDCPPIPIPLTLVSHSDLGPKALQLLSSDYEIYPFIIPNGIGSYIFGDKALRIFESLTLWQFNKDLYTQLFSYLEDTVCNGPEYEYFFHHLIMRCISDGERVRYSTWHQSYFGPIVDILSENMIKEYQNTHLLSILRELVNTGYNISSLKCNVNDLYRDSLELAERITLDTNSKQDPIAGIELIEEMDNYLNGFDQNINGTAELHDLNLKRAFLNELGRRVLLFNPFRDKNGRGRNIWKDPFQVQDITYEIAVFDQLLRLISECMVPAGSSDAAFVITPSQIAWDKNPQLRRTPPNRMKNPPSTNKVNRSKVNRSSPDFRQNELYHLDRERVSKMSGFGGFVPLKEKKYRDLVQIGKRLGIELKGGKNKIIGRINSELKDRIERRKRISPGLTDRWSDLMPYFIDDEKLKLLLSREGIVGLLYGDSLSLPGSDFNDPTVILMRGVLDGHRETLNRFFGDLEKYYVKTPRPSPEVSLV
jgi:hypothetical protein